MTDPDNTNASPVQNFASQAKRATRRMLLTLFALPAIIMTVLLLLPFILQDPDLDPSEPEQQRSLMILAASLVATYVVHRLTKSWAHPVETSQVAETGDNNGH